MTDIFRDPVFQAYTASVIALTFLLFGLGFRTALVRNARKIVVNPEDAGINGDATVAAVEHPDVLRIKRAHLNLIETGVPFFAIGLLYVLTAPSPNLARVLFAGFVIARLLHAIFYLSARQPFRTLSFVVGNLITLVMVVQLARELLPAMF